MDKLPYDTIATVFQFLTPREYYRTGPYFLVGENDYWNGYSSQHRIGEAFQIAQAGSMRVADRLLCAVLNAGIPDGSLISFAPAFSLRLPRTQLRVYRQLADVIPARHLNISLIKGGDVETIRTLVSSNQWVPQDESGQADGLFRLSVNHRDDTARLEAIYHIFEEMYRLGDTPAYALYARSPVLLRAYLRKHKIKYNILDLVYAREQWELAAVVYEMYPDFFMQYMGVVVRDAVAHGIRAALQNETVDNLARIYRFVDLKHRKSYIERTTAFWNALWQSHSDDVAGCIAGMHTAGLVPGWSPENYYDRAIQKNGTACLRFLLQNGLSVDHARYTSAASYSAAAGEVLYNHFIAHSVKPDDFHALTLLLVIMGVIVFALSLKLNAYQSVNDRNSGDKKISTVVAVR